ncbi:MAG TPA: hypothetical protein VIM68_08760 [Thermoanaerobaculia bacterium]
MRPGSLLLLILLTACPRDLVPQDGPDEAERYYAMKRQGSADPQRAYAIARAHMRRMQRFSTASESVGAGQQATGNRLQWTFLGPGNIGGRTRTLVIDPADPNVMYAGGVSGGVWKTLNAGARWDAIGDQLVNLAVNSMVMDPGDHNVLYVGTGEGYFREEVRGTGLPLRGDGIFTTRDGGASWQQLISTSTPDFHFVNDLAVSVHDSQRVYAATRTGVWRSNDSGQSWKRVLATSVKGGCLDLSMRIDTDGDTLFASCGTFDQATVYRATRAEGDEAWTSVLSEPDMGRTTLAIAPSRPSTIYALAASNTDQALLAVYRSDSNGDPGTWTARVRRDDPVKLNTLLLTNPITATQRECGGDADNPLPMGWYCNTIAVDPVDAERVFAAGVDLFRSDDGGRNWGVASFWWSHSEARMHSDQHHIVFDSRYDGAANQTMFVTNDGGVFRTDNARDEVATGPGATCVASRSKVLFTSLAHNYGVTQFYHGAVFPDGKRFLAGAQDNSTLLGDIARGTDWDPRIGGDGGYVAIDPVDPRHVYAEFQNANLYRSDDGGDQFKVSLRGGLSDDFLFVTPFTLDANQPSRLWIGGTHLWRTDDRGASWRVASTLLQGHVSAIAVAPRQSDRVVAGSTTGAIYMTSIGTTATDTTEWTRVQPREGWVSSLAFDPNDASILYATYAGFGGQHVWKSIDAGNTWTSIDGAGDASVPDIPVHSLVVDPSRPDRLYLGTDLGVFVSTDGGANWIVENTGFAAVVTEWVTVGQGERGPAVYAFTHGRGAWRAELAPGARRRAVRPR